MIRSSPATIAACLQRIPKLALFAAVLCVQGALWGVMILDRVSILRDGTEVTLRTAPVDPRDFLRGDYVTLRYDISDLQAGALHLQPVNTRNPAVFVKLAPDKEGVYQAVSVHPEIVPVQKPELLIRGTALYGACGNPRTFCEKLSVRYNLEKYFVPEGEGRNLEQVDRKRLTVVAAVLPSGRAAIKRLLVDGKPAYEEPWY